MKTIKGKFNFDKFISLDGSAAYLISGLVLLFMFLLYSQSDAQHNAVLSQLLIFGSLTGCFATGLVLRYQGKLTVKHMVIMVLICGFCVKLGYALTTGYQIRQHDVESLGSSGHLQYIYNLAYSDMLPDTNAWQFSHPPLHHFLAALVVKAGTFFNFSQDRCFESIQYLTVFYSTFTMIWFYKIMREIGIRGRALLFSVMLFSLHPTFTILAGSINNDMLTIMLCTGAVYYLIKWYKSPSFLYAAVLGLLSGLAMMSKFSAALMVAVIGVVVLVKVIKEQNMKWLMQAPVFLVLCLPLGLWYSIRNMQLFSQPLGYVSPLDTSSALYIGDQSIVSRLLFAPFKEAVSVFCDPWTHVNLISYTLKSSVFGEYVWDNQGLAYLLLVLNTALIGFTFYAIVKFFKLKKEMDFGTKLILLLNFFVQISSFLYFNLRYPFGCTMDFRYIVLTLVSGIAILAAVTNNFQKEAKKNKASHLKMSVFCAVSFSFSLLSVLLFV